MIVRGRNPVRIRPSLRSGRWPLVVLLALTTLTAVPAGAQQPRSQDPPPSPPERLELRQPQRMPSLRAFERHGEQAAMLDLRRRLIELDKLLSLGSLSRAESLLGSLEQHSGLVRELQPRRIRLAQLKGDWDEVLALTRSGLDEQPDNPSLWRARTEAMLATGQADSVRFHLDRFLGTSPNLSSAAVAGVQMLQGAGWYGASVSLIDSMRIQLGQVRFLARSRAIALLQVDRQEEAASEVALELRSQPYNLPLLRGALLDGAYDPQRHRRFGEDLVDRADSRDAPATLRLLAANLLLADGKAARALELVTPLFGSSVDALAVMRNTTTLALELDLLEDESQRGATLDYLRGALSGLLEARKIAPDQRRRAADALARTCEQALHFGALGDDPRQAVDRFGELLQQVRRVNPRSEALYSAQIRLAAYTRDVLREPGKAAGNLEHMLLDLDLPTEGVALVRLTLGECYLAAGDTARGRAVLTRLGRDPDFRAAGGHAHFHLARLDLAEGHFATARDRFAVVAIDHPTAPYANEALEMGLAIAEEMENPSGGPNVLALYARSVYFDLIGDHDRRVAALESFLAEAPALVDLEEPQHLLERAKYELAGLYASDGRDEEALRLWRRVVTDHPDGRFAAASLQHRADLLASEGRLDVARQELDLLMAQYPEYLFIDDVRDRRREWQ